MTSHICQRIISQSLSVPVQNRLTSTDQWRHLEVGFIPVQITACTVAADTQRLSPKPFAITYCYHMTADSGDASIRCRLTHVKSQIIRVPSVVWSRSRWLINYQSVTSQLGLERHNMVCYTAPQYCNILRSKARLVSGRDSLRRSNFAFYI